MWTLTCIERPAAKFRILQNFASLLFSSPYKPPFCCMGAGAFLCLCVYVWDKIMLFFLPPVNSCSHSSLDLHALGSSVHQQTEGLECLSPKIEQRNSVYSVREAPLWHSLNLIFYILHVWVTVSPAHGMLVFPNSVQTEIDELANML